MQECLLAVSKLEDSKQDTKKNVEREIQFIISSKGAMKKYHMKPWTYAETHCLLKYHSGWFLEPVIWTCFLGHKSVYNQYILLASIITLSNYYGSSHQHLIMLHPPQKINTLAAQSQQTPPRTSPTRRPSERRPTRLHPRQVGALLRQRLMRRRPGDARVPSSFLFLIASCYY